MINITNEFGTMWSGIEPKNMTKELMSSIEEYGTMTTAWKTREKNKNRTTICNMASKCSLFVIWLFIYVSLHHNDTFKNAKLNLDFELYGSWMMAV